MSPLLDTFPSASAASVKIEMEPLGSCNQPLWRSSSLDSGHEGVSFRVLRDNGSVVTSGKIKDSKWCSVGVVLEPPEDGNPDSVNDNGRMGGCLDWLRDL